jgi:hypothetical protein
MTKQEILVNIYNKLRLTGAVRSKLDFAEKINYNYTCTSAALNGSERYLNDRFFTRVLRAFPQVSESYVRSGEGEVLLGNANEENAGTGIRPLTERQGVLATVQIDKLIASLTMQQELTRRQQEQTEKAIEQIDKLIEIIRSMNGEAR